VHVANSGRSQLSRQNVPVELRIMSGSGDATDVYDTLDRIRSQKFKEVFPRSRGMPDCQYYELFVSSFSQERIPSSDAPHHDRTVSRRILSILISGNLSQCEPTLLCIS
jgi:hypothetical protein